jgi:hypothetical protein
MDPSVQFLLGKDVPAPEGATISSIAPQSAEQIDDDKIAFTLDVAMRLDQEQPPNDALGVVIPISENQPDDLAHSA